MADIAFQSGIDRDAAVALLEGSFSEIDFGIALLDEDLRLDLCNDRYMLDMPRYRGTPFPAGLSGAEIIAEIYQSNS